MARKVLNRKVLREEAEAAERAEPAKPEKKPAKRKSRAKEAAEVRMKLYWGVYNQALRRVALYEFNQKKQAEKKAQDLSGAGKTPHFVQPVKEAVQPTE